MTVVASLVLVAVALGATGLAHGALSALAALGVARGPYAAYRHDLTAQSLIWVGVIAAFAVAYALGESAMHAGERRADWLALVAARLTASSPARLLAVTFAIQSVTLLGLERAEQVAQFGHPLGVTAALGAPLLIGLALQALCGIIALRAMLMCMRAVIAAQRYVVVFVADCVCRLAATGTGEPRITRASARSLFAEIASPPAPLARKISNRPPPVGSFA